MRRGPNPPPAILLFVVMAWTTPVAGQQPRLGLEVGGLPAINFDADEGFGYGAIIELYQYGSGGRPPYLWTLQPTVFLTTEGRRDLTVFFDAPHLLPGGWRLDAFAGSEEQIATPYYGLGNDAGYDPDLETAADPYYYRFGRVRRGVALNVQKALPGGPLRVLVGVGASHARVTPVPEGMGSTLLAGELAGSPAPSGWTNSLRGGLIWDSRDREAGATRGTWTELLVQHADRWLGGDYRYTRTTLTDRRYLPLGRRVVLAHRVLLQQVTGDPPLHDLHRLQTSFKQQEGVGGAKSVRGVPKNRFVGRGTFVWNAEVRFRVAEFTLRGRPFHAVVSGFVDGGRVWSGWLDPTEILTDLHPGVGGGVRLGMGENFVVALDAGTSRESGMPLYIGLGYLY